MDNHKSLSSTAVHSTDDGIARKANASCCLRQPPAEILRAALTMLEPYFPGLTAPQLVAGILNELRADQRQRQENERNAGKPVDELLTVTECQALLKTSRSTIWNMRKSGALSAVTIPGFSGVRILKSEVIRLMTGGAATHHNGSY